MEWLMNPWVIIVIVLSVVIGNLAALKATANMKFKPKNTIHTQDNDISEKTSSVENPNNENRISEQHDDEKKDVH